MAKPKPEPKSVYFIGIKGVAMSGLAVMAKELGYEVRGSDVAEEFITDHLLKEHNLKYFNGFDAAHLNKANKPDLVVVGASFGPTNIEFKAAKSLRLPIISSSEMLGRLMNNFEGVGVAGTHGKTTTCSMLAFILVSAGFSPSYSIGTSDIPGLSGNGHIGDGKYFVAEADEYKKSDTDLEAKFLDLPLKHLIVTSIEYDHPDVYQTVEQIYNVFYRLSLKLPRDGVMVACSDWPLVRRLAARRVDREVLTFGFEPGAKYQITDLKETPVQLTFKIKAADRTIGPVELTLPGRHNVLNATAAVLMALQLGVTEAAIVKALRHFAAPKRRFELLGQFNGAEIFDDYAHHPTALRFLFDAARRRFPTKRIVAVFQPHTYSRTGKMLKEFASALREADKLILLNIWASAREKSGYVTIKDLIDATKLLKPDVEYRSSLDEAALYLKSFVTSKDVVLLIGAGDVYKIYDKLGRTE
ncbi:MAG TPA: UDP-N-acetylmuramate--L-alanine ligase [Candidatus Saccharimonadales bacterium]|nr:UDP-N-acetylmuramate--L-alanine ligase [Candidatus Saccharimonadales bacterium]